MKLMKTEEAIGQVLCHDITQIIPNVVKDVVFSKGHVIRPEDVPVLLSVGKFQIYIWEKDENLYHENEAAEILCKISQNKGMKALPPKEGKIDLIAEMEGLFQVDIPRLREINALGEMMIATISSDYPVKKGDKLCGMRVIPLVIEKEKMEVALKTAGETPLLSLIPFRPRKYGIVVTGREVFDGLITDKFSPVIEKKLDEYGCTLVSKVICDDNHENITKNILKMVDEGAEMVFCTGGMSVDPDDMTPLAIKNTGADIISYGAPVLPGAMFLISYFQGNIPICGLPGCVMYGKKTIFDLVLPRLLADVTVSPEWLAGLGHGGLCLQCDDCHFPNCGFGKGV